MNLNGLNAVNSTISRLSQLINLHLLGLTLLTSFQFEITHFVPVSRCTTSKPSLQSLTISLFNGFRPNVFILIFCFRVGLLPRFKLDHSPNIQICISILLWWDHNIGFWKVVCNRITEKVVKENHMLPSFINDFDSIR